MNEKHLEKMSGLLDKALGLKNENKKEVKKIKRIVIANAFSTNMLAEEKIKLEFEPVALEDVKEFLYQHQDNEIFSVVGHEATAEVFSQMLGKKIFVNRAFYQYSEDDILIVGNVMARLPEGKVLTKDEIKGVKIKWWIINRIF